MIKIFLADLVHQNQKQISFPYNIGLIASYTKLIHGENVEIIRPIDDVISPSNAFYQKTKDFIVEPYIGDPEGLVNRTLYQNEFENISKAYAPVGSVEKIKVGIAINNDFT